MKNVHLLFSKQPKRFKLLTYQDICDTLHYILNNITIIRFGSKLYRQIVETPMGFNCDSLVADSFLIFY